MLACDFTSSLWMAQSAPTSAVSASAMTDPVVVDPSGMRALATRMHSIVDDLARETIPTPALAGSAVSSMSAPGTFAARIQRLSEAIGDWAHNAVRCVGELAATDSRSDDTRSR